MKTKDLESIHYGTFRRKEMRHRTRVVRPFQSSGVFVEAGHDGLPNAAGLFKLFALSGQLLPDVFPLENVLEG